MVDSFDTIFMVFFGLLFWSFALFGVMSGDVIMRIGSASREDEPIMFWMHVAIYTVAGAMMLTGAYEIGL